jgi:Pyruvate/2-oxoacid:ferredoxin oxidoreductase delta subunit
MTQKRKIIEIDEDLCDGCGQCIISCAEGALQIVDGKAKLVSDVYCDGLGACLNECPTGALKMVEREAEEFDPEAVERRLEQLQEQESGEREPQRQGTACCPSQQLRTFAPERSSPGEGDTQSKGPSALTHWPVKIRLVPPDAPFLNNADLLVAADCGPVAHPGFHREFLQGRAVLIGCPKFDDVEQFRQKFRDIFTRGNVRSLTLLTMEVPCCSQLPRVVHQALRESGLDIPVQELVINARGEIVERSPQPA